MTMLLNRQWQFVQSSNITAIAYDEPSQKLFIQFNNGSTYEYYQVPSETYEDLMRAESQGKFFNQYIKKRFDYNRIEN